MFMFLISSVFLIATWSMILNLTHTLEDDLDKFNY